MMTFLDFAADNCLALLTWAVLGLIMGATVIHATDWKQRLRQAIYGSLLWGLTMGTIATYADYTNYKRHYITCNKIVAISAGYLMSDNKCWKPVGNGQYIKVTDKLKTAKELK